MKKQRRWVCFCLFISISVLLTAQLGSRAATVMSENTPLNRSVTVVIDAGHGGEDGGALSSSGIPESTYNLNIALRVESLLHLLGMDTCMTRESDISIYTEGETLAQKKRSDLRARVGIVNKTSHTLLVSIHQNIYSDGRYSGAQVFYAKTPGSKELAETIQHKFLSTLNPGSKRTIKKAEGIYLMEHIHSPGVLIECGFLSNPQEEMLLRDAAYQKKLACVIAASIKEYTDKTTNTNT